MNTEETEIIENLPRKNTQKPDPCDQGDTL